MMNIRKFSAWILTIIIVAVLPLGFCTVSAKADESAVPAYETVILDNENLLTEDEEKELSQHMLKLTEYGNVMFQSVKLSSSTDFEKYSEDTYYDYFGNEPGVIFQIDMGNRKLTLSSSTEMDDLIAYERDTIVDNVYRYATDEEYLRCASRCYDEIYDVINDIEIAHTLKYIDNALLAVLISLILNFIIVFAGSKKKTSTGKIVAALAASAVVADVAVKQGNKTKVYSPSSSGSGGSGGSFSGGGGGGGGGFSGGSSSHGF